jgi:hypothetical protein
VGDFNEILDNTETCEGGRRALRLMEDFKNTLVACELFELKATGHKYTWHNGRDEQDFIQEKLDRVTGTSEWCLLFPSAHVQIDEALAPTITQFQSEYRACLAVGGKGHFSMRQNGVWKRTAKIS